MLLAAPVAMAYPRVPTPPKVAIPIEADNGGTTEHTVEHTMATSLPE